MRHIVCTSGRSVSVPGTLDQAIEGLPIRFDSRVILDVEEINVTVRGLSQRQACIGRVTDVIKIHRYVWVRAQHFTPFSWRPS